MTMPEKVSGDSLETLAGFRVLDTIGVCVEH